ncbi:acetolactate synthase small subunit [Mobiluncus sp.]|mgnify:FL=1|uniref:acetolactate synthase small subunit n=1 Tax=Mobiluncus sp. TaxID=47293 RepID=UPI0025FF1411|nr:acetolactate synthase small subunit [Mobiluncus sp.]MDY6077554.1 acetolactate synthase small subunit [Mobiluncus sp.]
MSMTHTLSVLVENKPGVLTRVAALFARRAFNIQSLAVGETEKPEISRITIVVDVSEVSLEQVTKQLNKLVNVLKIVELEPERAVERELMLIKVSADDTNRTAVLQIVDLFRAHVVDVSRGTLVIESIGSPAKHAALLRELEPYGVREIVQSGNVAIGRGSKSITDQI